MSDYGDWFLLYGGCACLATVLISAYTLRHFCAGKPFEKNLRVWADILFNGLLIFIGCLLAGWVLVNVF